VAILTNFCSWPHLLYCGILLKYTQKEHFDGLYRSMLQYYFLFFTRMEGSSDKISGIHRYVNHSWRFKGWTVCTNYQEKRTWYRHVICLRTGLWTASWKNWPRDGHVDHIHGTHAVFHGFLQFHSYKKNKIQCHLPAHWNLFFLCTTCLMLYCSFNLRIYVTENHNVTLRLTQR
jgi:hypothetical protein